MAKILRGSAYCMWQQFQCSTGIAKLAAETGQEKGGGIMGHLGGGTRVVLGEDGKRCENPIDITFSS